MLKRAQKVVDRGRRHGVVVGSALVNVIERCGSNEALLLEEVGSFVARLKAPLRADS